MRKSGEAQHSISVCPELECLHLSPFQPTCSGNRCCGIEAISGATLPIGEYTVEGLGTSGNAMSIRSSDKNTKSLVLASRCESRKMSEQSKLVFHRYGNRYFLAQIWMAGNNAGHELPQSRREVEVARDYTLQDVVLVAALR